MNKAPSEAPEPLDPREGYDLIAASYDQWYWVDFWRRNEAPIVVRWLKDVTPGLLLDVGSGTGLYRVDLEPFGHRWISLDLSLAMLRVQRARLLALGTSGPLGLLQGDACALPFRRGVFDVVLCTRVLTHVHSIATAIEELSRVTKPGAVCIITDVHADHPYTHMSIDHGGKKLRVRTFHHSMDELRSSISMIGEFKLVDLEEYRLHDLSWLPPRDRFGKLYRDPRRPLFYTCRLIRL
jgi:ubiquinone/menaquinone biosynthesis C-methylase UbiE